MRIQAELIEHSELILRTPAEFPGCPKGTRLILKGFAVPSRIPGSEGQLLENRLPDASTVIGLDGGDMGAHLWSVDDGESRAAPH